jgi:hypothetical protein
LLQQAHILEVYKSDAARALPIYERVAKITGKADLKDWISKKVVYLKNQTRVGSL